MTAVIAKVCSGAVEGSLDIQEDSSPISSCENLFSQILLKSLEWQESCFISQHHPYPPKSLCGTDQYMHNNVILDDDLVKIISA